MLFSCERALGIGAVAATVTTLPNPSLPEAEAAAKA